MKKTVLILLAVIAFATVSAQNVKFYSGKIETRSGDIIKVQKLGQIESGGFQAPIIFSGKVNGSLVYVEDLGNLKKIDLREYNARGNRITVEKKNGQRLVFEEAFIRMRGDDIYSPGLYYTRLNPVTDNYDVSFIKPREIKYIYID